MICPFFSARADDEWPVADNETLYSNTLSYLKTIQYDFAGEPIYYQFQNALVQIESAHQSNEFIWMKQVHALCNTLEDIYSPSMEHPSLGYSDKYKKIRYHLVRLRDYPMHEVSSTSESVQPKSGQAEAFSAATYQYTKKSRDQVLEFLKSPRPTGSEMQVVKLVSSGYIFRTKDACIGIDIMFNQAYGSTDYVNDVASYLDVLYVTHPHGDHYDTKLLEAVCNRGKTIVMNSQIVSPTSGQVIIWNEDHLSPTLIQGVANTRAISGNQGDTPCLIYHITIGDWTIVHLGDNSNHTVESKFSQWEMPDVVIDPIFQGLSYMFTSLNNSINTKGIKPTYFTAHENEFHHLIEGRISYKYLYENKYALGNPSETYPCCVVMDCGEAMTLSK